MKNCKHIQEMLMTDYHDGVLSAVKRASIDGHLKTCADCHAISLQVYNQTIKPFNQVKSQMPDDFCWSQIKRRINQAPAVRPKTFVFGWRLASASLSFCVLLIVAGITYKNMTINQTPYLSYVLASDTESVDEVTNNIEQYFL